jgi:hypothetical protein
MLRRHSGARTGAPAPRLSLPQLSLSGAATVITTTIIVTTIIIIGVSSRSKSTDNGLAGGRLAACLCFATVVCPPATSAYRRGRDERVCQRAFITCDLTSRNYDCDAGVFLGRILSDGTCRMK